MNTSIEEQLEEQIDETLEGANAEISKEPLRFSKEILERDQRETDIVEVNFRNLQAMVVNSSKAPKLTQKILKEKGKPIRDGEIIFDNKKMTIGVFHGKPLTIEIELQRILEEYAEQDMTSKLLAERKRRIEELMVAFMIADPIFSYKGEPADGYPVEKLSDVLLAGFYEEYMVKNTPLEDDIYQCEVLRNQPIETAVLLGKTFEQFPVIPPEKKNEKVTDLLDDEMENFIERSNAQRAIQVSSFIISPKLTCESADPKSKRGRLAVDHLSEGTMQMLYNAYRAVSIPKESLAMAQRFRRFSSNANREVHGIGDNETRSGDRDAVQRSDNGGSAEVAD